jgi:hypothetical protein
LAMKPGRPVSIASLTMQAQRRFDFALGLVSASQAPLQRRAVCLAKLVC